MAATKIISRLLLAVLNFKVDIVEEESFLPGDIAFRGGGIQCVE